MGVIKCMVLRGRRADENTMGISELEKRTDVWATPRSWVGKEPVRQEGKFQQCHVLAPREESILGKRD